MPIPTPDLRSRLGAERRPRELDAEVGASSPVGARSIAPTAGAASNVDVPAFVVTHHVPDGWPRPGSTVSSSPRHRKRRCSSEIGCRPEVGGVHGAQPIQQCLDAGLLDETSIWLPCCWAQECG
jgi:hypothetical protein